MGMVFTPRRVPGKRLMTDLVVRARYAKKKCFLEFSISQDANASFKVTEDKRIQPEYDPDERVWRLRVFESNRVIDAYQISMKETVVRNKHRSFTLRVSCDERDLRTIFGAKEYGEYVLLEVKDGVGTFGLQE